MVEVSKNVGMGNAAIGLAGPGVGIGLVFAALLNATARNPALRGQLFTYAILGFAFVEAIGLFDLMVALMAKFVRETLNSTPNFNRAVTESPSNNHPSINTKHQHILIRHDMMRHNMTNIVSIFTNTTCLPVHSKADKRSPQT